MKLRDSKKIETWQLITANKNKRKREDFVQACKLAGLVLSYFAILYFTLLRSYNFFTTHY